MKLPLPKLRQPQRPHKGNILLGVQGQLIAVLGGITLVTLLLVWVLINYFLQPQYNRTIRSNLERHVLYSNAPADRLAGLGKKQLLGLGMQQIPFFQRHFTSSFFLNGTGKTVFACGDNKRECVARWQRIEPETFGINGLISLDVGRAISINGCLIPSFSQLSLTAAETFSI